MPLILRTLRTGRWVGLSLVVVVLCLSFWRLGLWQWHRAESKRAQAHAISQAAAAAPVPVSSLLHSGGVRPPKSSQWRKVDLVGTYDIAHTVLLRNRTLDGVRGFEVLVPLVQDGGDGAALLVDRGFVPEGDSASADVVVPAPPTGRVSTTARVRLDEQVSAQGLRFAEAAGHLTVGHLDVSRIRERLALPYPVLDAFGELVAETPSAGTVPSPQQPDEPSDGLNLAYAIQWWIFCLFAVGGWVLLLRREIGESAQDPEHDVSEKHVGTGTPQPSVG